MAKNSSSNFPEWLGKPNEVSARMKNQSQLVEPTPYYQEKTIVQWLPVDREPDADD